LTTEFNLKGQRSHSYAILHDGAHGG